MLYDLVISGTKAIYTDAEEGVRLRADASLVIGMEQVPEFPPLPDDYDYAAALDAPSAGRPLGAIAREKKARSACIIISDITRGVPTRVIAPHLLRVLTDAGIAKEHIVFIVALGVHRAATEEEMRSFVGDACYAGCRVVNHDAYDDEALVYVGTTADGTRVRVNKLASECDLRIGVGKVELHEFAGFSGGRKSVLPGIAAEDAILYNHRPERIQHPLAKAGILENNPVHRDMVEAAHLLGLDFVVNFITAQDGSPAGVYTGEMEGSHELAAKRVSEVTALRLDERPDILVVTCGSPFNCDLYQALKSLFAVTHILDAGMQVVFYAACPDGVSSPDMLDALGRFASLDDVDDYVLANYRIQMDHVLPLTALLRTGAGIFAHSANVGDAEFATFRMQSHKNAQAALDAAVARSGKQAPRILFFPQPQKAVITAGWLDPT